MANDLGGEEAYLNLRDRAWQRGIRLGSDMVPNHMGIDSQLGGRASRLVPSLPYPPYPAYTFDGPDVSNDGRVEIKIEDHYYDRTDAAVVFRRAIAGRATRATSITATMAPAFPGTIPRS